MKSLKKNALFITTMMLLVVGSTLYINYKNTFLTTDSELALTTIEPYLIEKLEYVDSFVIPDVNSSSSFDTLLSTQPTAAVLDTQAIASIITQEINDSFHSAVRYPLPLLAHWNSGDVNYVDVNNSEGMTPAYVISLIEDGTYILPSWKLEPYWTLQQTQEYYKESILRAKELNLPLTFIIDPLESSFINNNSYFTLPTSENPNVVDANSNILEKISPFGDNSKWSELGANFASSSLMQLIQEWYPNPPLIMFVDNKNENKLSWNELNTSKRYIDDYGYEKDDTFKRTLVGAQWIEKYRLLRKSFKDNLLSQTWKTNTKFISFNPDTLDIGSSNIWHKNSSITNQFFSVWPETTDATNIELNVDGTIESLNKAVFNSNNIPFVKNEAHKLDANSSYQLSISSSNSLYTQEQYRGYAQLVMWLTRPSIIRELNSETNDKGTIMSNYKALVDSVQLIHNDTILQDFWKNGELVVNNNSKIEQSINTPLVYENSEKWFLLDTNVNPVGLWTTGTDVPVYSIALKTGTAPNRAWLVYAQSPNGVLENISVSIPEYQDIIINTSESGNFYVVSENSAEYIAIVDKSTDNNDSIYSEEVNIPTYNPNDTTHVLITQTNGMWTESVLNDLTKQHFYIEPGDYLSNRITLTTSGTVNARRTLSLYNGNDLHPAKLLDSEQANIGLTFDNSSYWIVDRISNINDTHWPSFYITWGSTHNILNRLHLKNYLYGVIIRPFCHYNTIQNSYLNHMSHAGRLADNVGIAVANAGTENTQTLGTKILNNDIRNALDGIQLILSSDVLTEPDYAGTIIDSNRIWVDGDIYTNGDYNINGYNQNGEYMIAENAMDIKAGSSDVLNPMIITNNVMYGYREVDTTAGGGYSGGAGAAFVVHYGTENVVYENNLVFDSQSSFAAGSPLFKPFSIKNWSIKNNISYDINLVNPTDRKTYNMYIYYGQDIKVENNMFINVQPNSGGSGVFFSYDKVFTGNTFKNNVAIDSHGTSSIFYHDDFTLNDNISIVDIDNNYFYDSTETLRGTNTNTYYTPEEAKLEPQTFNISKFKELKTIELNVKTSDASPHKSLFIAP